MKIRTRVVTDGSRLSEGTEYCGGTVWLKHKFSFAVQCRKALIPKCSEKNQCYFVSWKRFSASYIQLNPRLISVRDFSLLGFYCTVILRPKKLQKRFAVLFRCANLKKKASGDYVFHQIVNFRDSTTYTYTLFLVRVY